MLKKIKQLIINWSLDQCTIEPRVVDYGGHAKRKLYIIINTPDEVFEQEYKIKANGKLVNEEYNYYPIN